jgi:membrane-associated phospholipid phosphatase
MRNSPRGAIPILLATFCLLARPGHAVAQTDGGTSGLADATADGPSGGIPLRPAYPTVRLSAFSASSASSALSVAPASPTEIHWYHAAAALGAVALISLADEPLRDQLQAHRTSGKDDLARVFKHMGQPEVYAVVGLGTIAVGLIGGNDKVTRAGERITAGLLTAGVVTSVLKVAVGRERPESSDDAYSFKPFSGQTSWPSGHTTMAFALAASVSDEVHSIPVTIGMYTGATLTGWSRLNDNKHWLSDVVMGALVGISSAKLMNGRWTVFGLHAPKFLLEPGAVGVNLRF